MKEPSSPSPSVITPAPDTGDLRIVCRPYNNFAWEFHGTRAQLEAEGVIPPSTVWPQSGTAVVSWIVGRALLTLRRTRPPGVKGPARLWQQADWWYLRSDLQDPPSYEAQRIEELRAALDDALWRTTPEGRRALGQRWARRHAAQQDPYFRAFLARITPAMTRPPRGRPSKAAPTQGASA